MIELVDVCKRYPTNSGVATILDRVNLRVDRGERVGILGRNGAGKSTMIRLLGGIEPPSSGVIRHDMTVSWPLAFGGAFQTSLTGVDNLRFICRIYNVDYRDKIPFVQEFSELGAYLYEPIRVYSSGMRARLAFAISMVVEFDCFLIDEIVSVGDQRFHEKCHIELFEKRADRAMIIVSHDAHYVRATCNKLGVLLNGHLSLFEDVEEGFAFYHESTHPQ